MRKFGLITSTGKEIDLTSDTIFFHQPDGLGYDENASYRRIGSRWILLDRYEEQGEISGTLIFMGRKPYNQYRNFVYNTYRTGLKLTYTVDDGNTLYLRDVIISSIQKTELNLGGYLECPITFKASTPWYLVKTISTKPVRLTAKNGWIWERYSTWAGSQSDRSAHISFRSAPDMTLSINIKSNILSPCALMINGPMTNPRWRHTTGSTVRSEGLVNCTIGEHQFLVIDNRTAPYSIKIFREASDEDGYTGWPDYKQMVSNVYDKSDFGMERFIQLRRGDNDIEVYSLEPSTGTVFIALEANIYHASV